MAINFGSNRNEGAVVKTFRRSVFLAFLTLFAAGCSKSPSGLYIDKSEMLGQTITHRADFRSDGTCYYQGLFDDFQQKLKWQKAGSKIRILKGDELVLELQFEGNDLITSDGKTSIRFIKQ